MNNIQSAIRQYLTETGFVRFSLKAVLFDMDGVLYDSMPGHAFSWSKVMREHGFDMTEEDAYRHEGRTGDDTINIVSARAGRNIPPEERQQIYSEKIQAFASYPVAEQMKGSGELLRQVADSGLLAMLVTGSGQPTLLERLNCDFPGVFARQQMVTSFDVKRGKPDPEPYLTALEKGCLKPWEAIVVENAPLGVEAARKAGLFTIAVNTGPLPDATLLNAGANCLFPSVETLSKQWPTVLKQFTL